MYGLHKVEDETSGSEKNQITNKLKFEFYVKASALKSIFLDMFDPYMLPVLLWVTHIMG